MYKNQNIFFGQTGIKLGIIQKQHLLDYIQEYPEHTIFLSQWLFDKKYLSQDQIQIVSSYVKQHFGGIQKTGVLKRIERENETAPRYNSSSVESTKTEAKKINRYEIVSVLGQGGMGKVYKVFDPLAQKELALKVLLGQASKQAVSRFRREADTMARLHHPGIVKAHDIGFENEEMFFTMDLVQGSSLKELQFSNPMSIKKSIRFIIKVCEVMAYAHSQGVVHRDLKPANIMVHEDNPIIMDFGLARVNDASQKLSKTGVMMGTLRYTTPEQLEGKHTETTEQSDLYSIGAILYELLARRPIFGADTHLALINCVLNKIPDSLSEINPKIPKELEDICNKALAKEKKHRYKNCDSFANELRMLSADLNANDPTKINRSTGAHDLRKLRSTGAHDLRKLNRSTSAHDLRKLRSTGAYKKTSKRNYSKNYTKEIIIGSILFISLLIFLASENSSRNTPITNSEETIATNDKEQENNPLEKDVAETVETKDKDKEQTDNPLTTEENKETWQETMITGFNIQEYEVIHEKTNIRVNTHIGVSTNIAVKANSLIRRYRNRGNLLACLSGGRMTISFNLQPKKHEKLFICFNHLASGSKGINLSYINITFNNKVIAHEYEVTVKSAPQNKEFEITNEAKLGENTVELEITRKSVTNYWLYGFSVISKEKTSSSY